MFKLFKVQFVQFLPLERLQVQHLSKEVHSVSDKLNKDVTGPVAGLQRGFPYVV